MPQLSDVEAMQLLVRQLHAIIYGYQLAIGQLADGGRRDSAFGRLREHRILLDWLTTALVARSAQVPVAEPAYVPSVNPRSDATRGAVDRVHGDRARTVLRALARRREQPGTQPRCSTLSAPSPPPVVWSPISASASPEQVASMGSAAP